MIGTRLGSLVGWPAERVDRLRGEFNAFAEAESARMAAAASAAPSQECPALRDMLVQVARNSELGETGNLREWVARSGRSAADFIGAERARQAQAAAPPASAAAAPLS